MVKNVLNPITLLIVAFIFVLTACSVNNDYSSHYNKRKRAQKTSRSQSNRSIKSYTSSSSKRKAIVSTAKKYIGRPYVYGGKNPSGFDCSGFTQHVFQQNGIKVNGPSTTQSKQGKKKSLKQLKKGDLIFFGKRSKVSHVAIVANVDQDKLEVIHSTSSRGVVIDDISRSEYWKKRYLFGRDVLN